MTTNRSASDKLIWYFYQFDKSILEVINQPDENSEVTIEWVEDIDSSTENTQVKYYTSKKIIKNDWTKSTDKEIWKAILLLLITFKTQNKNTCLYWYFRNNTNETFTLDRLELNSYIQSSYSELNTEQKAIFDTISDNEKNNFLEHFSIKTWPKYQDQKMDLIDKLKNHFWLSTDLDWEFHYNYALAIITELACKTNINDRRITKSQLANKISSPKDLLYNVWFFEKTEQSKYIKHIKKTYFTYRSTPPKYERFFIIHVNWTENLVTYKNIVIKLIDKFFNIRREIINWYPPFILFVWLNEEKEKELKNLLWTEWYKLKDWYNYKNADFCWNTLSTKFHIKDNYKFRFIDGFDNLQTIFDLIWDRTKEIYQFYLKEWYQKINNSSSGYFCIKIGSIEHIINIFNS